MPGRKPRFLCGILTSLDDRLAITLFDSGFLCRRIVNMSVIREIWGWSAAHWAQLSLLHALRVLPIVATPERFSFSLSDVLVRLVSKESHRALVHCVRR